MPSPRIRFRIRGTKHWHTLPPHDDAGGSLGLKETAPVDLPLVSEGLIRAKLSMLPSLSPVSPAIYFKNVS